ncbi:MAG: putative hydro-lyase [Beijerinckiaceae bacterium]
MALAQAHRSSEVKPGVFDLASPADVRRAARAGALDGPTSGLAHGFVQANLAILPAEVASDFLRFCQRNPKPCPVVGMTEPGDPRLAALGADLDIRTDVPRYRIWRDGVAAEEPTDLLSHWRDDLVTFVIGCSHSFEEALIADGLTLKHVSACTTVPMYRTNIACAPAGRFSGPLVVTMRPYKAADAIRAVQVTTRFPAVHGAPVHLGRPDLIGITDLAKPDWGDPVPVEDDEIPVFWACGVTPQAVIQAARIPFAITHYPGRMLVTDIPNSKLAVM